jgi:hypothetical protein
MSKLSKRLKRRDALYRGLVMAGAMSAQEAEMFVDVVDGPLPKPAKVYPTPSKRGGREAAKAKRTKRGRR